MGREGSSRGTTQIHRTLHLGLAAHFVPTNISFPHNAGIAVRTSCSSRWHLALRSHERLKRELRLGSDECNFQRAERLHLSDGFCQRTFLGHCL